MTPDEIFMLWIHGELTFEGAMWVLDVLHPVAATPAANVFPALAESAPTWWALVTAEAANTDYLGVAA